MHHDSIAIVRLIRSAAIVASLCSLGCVGEPPIFGPAEAQDASGGDGLNPALSDPADGQLDPIDLAHLPDTNPRTDFQISDDAGGCQPDHPERCNGVDDDCDGRTDEALGTPETICYSSGTGECQRQGVLQCVAGALTCSAREARPAPEICNELDDDCNGIVDDLPQIGMPCSAGQNACERDGLLYCDLREQTLACDAELIPVRTESCNGLDDDCDGSIDEQRVCGPYIQAHCQFFLAWPDDNRYPAGLHDTIGQCPGQERSEVWPEHCVGTRGEGLMRALRFPSLWGFDWNDAPGVMFRCQSPFSDDTADWIQQSCRVFLGYARNSQLPARTLDWGPCPEQDSANQGERRCVSSNANGQFNLMDPISGGDPHVAGPGDTLGIAFVCDDQDQQRARSVQESVSLVLAFANDGTEGAANDVEDWPGCTDGRPLRPGEIANCAQTDGTGAFATLPLLRHWAQGYHFFNGNPRYSIAISLRALPAERDQQ